MTVELRPITDDEFGAYQDAAALAFGGRHADPATLDQFRRATELDRTLAAFDGRRLVGTAGAYSFAMGLPGGVTAPTAGVTRVTVAPTDRRQGLLRALMRRQLDDIHERREPLAILYASEGAIYERFGYGVATWQAEVSIARARSAFVEHVRPRVAVITAEEAAATLLDFHNAMAAEQPGMIARSREWWDFVTADPPTFWRPSGGDRRYAVHRGQGGAIDGFTVFRVEPKWEEGTPSGTVHVALLLASTPAAYAELWRFCLDLDLMSTVRAEPRPVAEPLRHLLVDPRALSCRVDDGIWARLVDVPAALAARRYRVEDSLVLEVVDEFCAWNSGRWQLTADVSGAECRRTSREPDLVVTAAQLGWCYLGSNRFADMRRAGRLEGEMAAAERADAMFATAREAWCPTHF